MGVFSSPSIPLDGLVFSIDAGNSKSYSGSGVTANGLIGGANGALLNGTGYSSVAGGCWSFDGTDDGINTTINIDNDPIGIHAWIYCTEVTSVNGRGIVLSDNGGWDRGLEINDSKWGVHTGNSLYKVGTVSNNTWYNIFLSYSSNVWTLYVNGSFVFSSTSTTSPGSLATIGRADYFSTRIFQGLISQVQIYNRALTATEIIQLYNATKDRYSYKEDIVKNGLLLNYDIASQISYINPGTTIQSTINNYIGTLTNGPTYNSGNGGYLSFDGTNDYINILPSSATFSYNRSSFTVGGWTYMTSFPVSYFGVILSKWNSGGGNDNEFILNTDDGNKFLFAVDLDDSLNPNTQTNDLVISNTTIVANTWYYVVGTFENGTIKLYVNGVLESSVTNILTTVKTNLNSSLDIGRFGTSAYSTGRRAVIHMYNRALTSTEILSNFNALRGRYGI